MKMFHEPRSLTNNRISDDGARALAEALPSCTALTTLQYGRGCCIHCRVGFSGSFLNSHVTTLSCLVFW